MKLSRSLEFRFLAREALQAMHGDGRRFLAKARTFARALPAWLRIYLALLYSVMALLVWWMPACDFDTMTSYLARIALERIGPLRQTATLEIQYLFPKFFDYLHAPLLEWGWFETLPNFALFTIALCATVWRLPTAAAVRIVLGCAACSPLLVAATSAKNDITLALLAYLFWLWIYHSNPRRCVYPAGCVLIAAAMLGTKWHGLALTPMFLALALIEVVKARNFRPATVLATLCVLPAAWHMSSAEIYLENVRTEGSLCPTPPYLKETASLRQNLMAFAANNALETFEVPFYAADTLLHGRIWRSLNRVTLGAKAWNYAIMPTTHVSVYGASILVVLGGALLAASRRTTPWPVRASALVALGYCGLLLACFRYSTWVNRYFLTTYLLGLVSCAHLASSAAPPRWLARAFYGYLVFTSLHSVLLNQEKRLLPFRLYVAAEDRYEPVQRPLYADLFDREALRFHLWTGHLNSYRVLRQNLREGDRLLIVNYHQGNDCPFIYPYLKERTSANTRIVNLRFGQSPPANLSERFDYILAFNGRRSDPSFVALAEDGGVAVYRNSLTASRSRTHRLANSPGSAEVRAATREKISSMRRP